MQWEDSEETLQLKWTKQKREYQDQKVKQRQLNSEINNMKSSKHREETFKNYRAYKKSKFSKPRPRIYRITLGKRQDHRCKLPQTQKRHS